MSSKNKSMLVIDFGGQYSHLIARRIRDLGVLTDLVEAAKLNDTQLENIGGIILSGGPKTVGATDSPSIPTILHTILEKRTTPVLGICYGHQLLAHFFGGELRQSSSREYGRTIVTINMSDSMIFVDGKSQINAWMSHGDHVHKVPEDFDILASTDDIPVAAMKSKDHQILGVQFHPEVTHTEDGFYLLDRFVTDICKLDKQSWDMRVYKDLLINEMISSIGDQTVLLGVSGGVDSLVASLVLNEAIGEKLHLVFIDTGLLRKNEVQQVIDYYEKELDQKNFHFVDASENFLGKLEKITDPERKRTIIGHTFIEVFEETATKLEEQFGKFQFLAQGTIFPDRVESGSVGDNTATIKSHHNLALPEKMRMSIIEPLKDLYKDEVRELGLVLDAPEHMIHRYPFPGPGLAVRILGAIDREQVRILQEADHIFLRALAEHQIIKEVKDVWQAFAVLLPVKAVGVQGDNRTYGYIIALRAVYSRDGMTADFAKIPHNLLGKVANQIVNELPEVTRVVYDITSKPPATIEFE